MSSNHVDCFSQGGFSNIRQTNLAEYILQPNDLQIRVAQFCNTHPLNMIYFTFWFKKKKKSRPTSCMFASLAITGWLTVLKILMGQNLAFTISPEEKHSYLRLRGKLWWTEGLTWKAIYRESWNLHLLRDSERTADMEKPRSQQWESGTVLTSNHS